MRHNLTAALLFAAVVLAALPGRDAGAQEGQRPAAEDEASLRQILAEQPDYTAVQQLTISDGRDSFGSTGKVARRGARLREWGDDVVVIHDPARPTIKIYPKRKQYAEMPAEEMKGTYDSRPEGLARRDDTTFKSLGTDKVGQYDCRKIEVGFKDAKQKGARIVLCAAPSLKNLVVFEQVILGSITIEQVTLGSITMTSVLSDVALGAPEELFRVPDGYKKVFEKSPDGQRKELSGGFKKRTGWRP